MTIEPDYSEPIPEKEGAPEWWNNFDDALNDATLPKLEDVLPKVEKPERN